MSFEGCGTEERLVELARLRLERQMDERNRETVGQTVKRKTKKVRSPDATTQDRSRAAPTEISVLPRSPVHRSRKRYSKSTAVKGSEEKKGDASISRKRSVILVASSMSNSLDDSSPLLDASLGGEREPQPVEENSLSEPNESVETPARR